VLKLLSVRVKAASDPTWPVVSDPGLGSLCASKPVKLLLRAFWPYHNDETTAGLRWKNFEGRLMFDCCHFHDFSKHPTNRGLRACPYSNRHPNIFSASWKRGVIEGQKPRKSLSFCTRRDGLGLRIAPACWRSLKWPHSRIRRQPSSRGCGFGRVCAVELCSEPPALPKGNTKLSPFGGRMRMTADNLFGRMRFREDRFGHGTRRTQAGRHSRRGHRGLQPA
jgi:hypothetical protein